MSQFFILRSRVQQEYNSLLVNALNRIFKSNLYLNTFKWPLTEVELSCVRNIIPRSRKRLWNGYPVLNQELQNHDPFGRHIPYPLLVLSVAYSVRKRTGEGRGGWHCEGGEKGKFIYLSHLLYGMCVKIFIMNRYISKSYITSKNTIDRQYTERGKL